MWCNFMKKNHAVGFIVSFTERILVDLTLGFVLGFLVGCTGVRGEIVTRKTRQNQHSLGILCLFQAAFELTAGALYYCNCFHY